jgi:hypothetical protein
MITQACISEPVSWLRLETFALDHRDTAVREHVAACPACKQCLDEIERDIVALPPLAVPEKKRRTAWWRIAIPAGIWVAAIAILLLVIRPRPSERPNEVRIKGVGVVVMKLVRERAGAITMDARTYRDGDRFKLVVTCPPDHTAHFELRVQEAGSQQTDRPVSPADLVCGNEIAMPGAFSITGTKANVVCVDVTGPTGDVKTACVTLRPE